MNIIRSSRIESIDLLRGIVLILMLVDHTRGFFSNIADPMSLTDSTIFVYFTRWITHFCAPAFIFLSGVSAYLYAYRSNQGVSHTSYFLVTRGVWFVIMQWTLIFVAWTFFLTPYELNFKLFATIGFCMIFLSILIFLPHWLIGVISLLLIVGHNLFDNITASSLNNGGWLWMIFHEPGRFYIGSFLNAKVDYPLVPWIGVMSLGYFMGPLFMLSEKSKRQHLLVYGIIFTLAFIIIRFMNIYGDPNPWSVQDNTMLTIMSFLDTYKYPPSLSFLLMTLGPSCLFLSLISEKWCTNKFNQIIITYGKVPFFFYLVHLPLILGTMLIIVAFNHGIGAIFTYHNNILDYGYSIEVVYFMWLLFLFLLYYPCLWYGQYKAQSKKWYWSYI